MDLYAEERGAGPVVLVLHGLFGSSTNWRTFTKRLAATHRVLAVDLRNHGRSPHAEQHDYDAMAADLCRFLDQRALSRVALVGHSMGGKAAMRLAMLRPDRVERLAALDVSPERAPADRSVLDTLSNVELRPDTSRADVERQLSGALTDARLRAFLLMGLQRTAGGVRWRFNLRAIADSYDAIVGAVSEGRFDGPALFLRGSLSAHVSNGDMAAIRARFSSACIHTIPNAGHWLHVDAPEETFVAVREFLTDAGDSVCGGSMVTRGCQCSADRSLAEHGF